MAGSSSSTSTEDIRKMGHLVKIKTNKRKYFVLRDETKSSPSRLEYYDSEKKWRSGLVPKRTIVLKNCFNINAKPDAKHKYAIALYTKDDCFSVSCQSEDEQQDWLTNMIELRNRTLDESTVARPLFEHIWPVTVKSRGLGGNERKVIPGQYRLCLTNKDLSLIRMNNDQSDIVLPLDCIRRCGHTHQFFFLELGRSAITGSGSLWLQVEDMVISQNIHEALLSSMKNNEVPTTGIFRVRSGSSAMENRKRASMAPTGGSSTLHTQAKRAVSIYTSNPSPNMQTETSVRKSSLSESSMQNSVLSGRRTDGTIEEEPVKPCHYMTINTMTESPTVEIVTGYDGGGLRFPSAVRGDEMTSFQMSKPPVIAAVALSPSEMMYDDHSDYVPMVTPTGESYMVMAVRRLDDCHGLGLEPLGSSSSVSSAMSSAGSMSILESSDRFFHSHSLSHLQEVAAADGGYIEMTSPQNLAERSSFPLRPDVVQCYLRDEGTEEFPKRAYSVGSKPVPVVNKPLNNSYIDMSGKSSTKKEAEKSSSAPHLNDDDEKKRELSDLFMELDFNRSKRDVNHKGATEFRGRASSGGSRELRMKAMSFSAKEAIQRFSLFSKNKPSVATQQHTDVRRPRTSTICQESLRPRTSSFGPSDLRPRSSSGGNACFVDVMSRQLQPGGELSSQDSLRRHGKRSSQERVKSGKSDTYVNMNLGRRSTERLKMAESDAGYMDMKPGEDVGEPNYMRMSAGTSVPTPAATTSSENTASARTSIGAMMKQKLEVVEAGGSEDYLSMTPQPKTHSVAPSIRPRVKVTKSTDEMSSSYMDMAPRGASSERSVAANSERKDIHSSRKSDDYMEMSVGGSGKHRDSTGASSQAQSVAADAHAHTTSELARSSVTLASSPNREDFKESDRELSTSPKDDIPPPPFELSFPSPSYILRADQAPTIPGQSPAYRTEPQAPATDGSASERLPTGQISYATLDLGSSVDHRPAAPLVGGRGGTGAVGRGRNFGPGSHQHIYAQIDFEKTEDC